MFHIKTVPEFDVSNKVETTNQKTTSVKTGDETNVVIFVSLSMVSGGLFLVLRKEYERVH